MSGGGTSLIIDLSFKDLYGKALEVQELFDSVEELTNQIRIETGLRCPPPAENAVELAAMLFR